MLFLIYDISADFETINQPLCCTCRCVILVIGYKKGMRLSQSVLRSVFVPKKIACVFHQLRRWSNFLVCAAAQTDSNADGAP